jgi:hypothetical protein
MRQETPSPYKGKSEGENKKEQSMAPIRVVFWAEMVNE